LFGDNTSYDAGRDLLVRAAPPTKPHHRLKACRTVSRDGICISEAAARAGSPTSPAAAPPPP
jgi:hypothetical protein